VCVDIDCHLRYHHLLKFYLWRILNVSLIFLTRFLVSRGYLVNLPIYSWIGTPTSQQDRCDLGDLGDQFLFIFVFVYVRFSFLSHTRMVFCCLSFDSFRGFFLIVECLECIFLADIKYRRFGIL
jgi:hypothetical protein